MLCNKVFCIRNWISQWHCVRIMNMGHDINVEQEWNQLKLRLRDRQYTEDVLVEYQPCLCCAFSGSTFVHSHSVLGERNSCG
jgi:hypothetical protein